MSETVTITMTRDHAQVVQNACEMLMRMKLGIEPKKVTNDG